MDKFSKLTELSSYKKEEGGLARVFADQLNAWLDKDYCAINNLIINSRTKCNEKMVDDEYMIVSSSDEENDNDYLSVLGLLNGLLHSINSDYLVIAKISNSTSLLIGFDIVEKQKVEIKTGKVEEIEE